MMYLFTANLLIGLYAYCMARFQAAIVLGMITYWPQENPYTKPFHKFGGALALLTAMVLSIAVYAFSHSWWKAGAAYITSDAIYFFLFNGLIGKKVWGDWWYLGTTAATDRILHKTTPKTRAISTAAVVLIAWIVAALFK